eukprot:scaffold858_cov171-Ochromonas_danica.AAC.5
MNGKDNLQKRDIKNFVESLSPCTLMMGQIQVLHEKLGERVLSSVLSNDLPFMNFAVISSQKTISVNQLETLHMSVTNMESSPQAMKDDLSITRSCLVVEIAL